MLRFSAPQALDQGDRTGTGLYMSKPCALDQVCSDHAIDDAQRPPHDLGPAGKQKAQWQRETQQPLAHGLLGQHIVDQQGRVLGHPPCPAARAKTPTFATEGEQVLGVTRLAAHPQEAVFQPAAFEVILKLALHIARQLPALLRQMGSERRIILVDDPIEQGLLGPVTLVTTSIPLPGGHPCRRRVGHDPRPCDTVFLERLSPGCAVLKHSVGDAYP